MPVTIDRAQPDDLPAVLRPLERHGLPLEGETSAIEGAVRQ
jgi:hypothetical protein